jgi:hypothetical protein
MQVFVAAFVAWMQVIWCNDNCGQPFTLIRCAFENFVATHYPCGSTRQSSQAVNGHTEMDKATLDACTGGNVVDSGILCVQYMSEYNALRTLPL